MRLGLDIGCGNSIVQLPNTSFIRLDIAPEANPNIISNATLLPFADCTFDVVHSSHVLEHFPRAVWKSVLWEWLRVLKRDGEVWFNLPNITWAAEQIVLHKRIDEHVLNVLYGGQDNDYDFHYVGLTPEIMQLTLRNFGFEFIHLKTEVYNMFIGAKRPEFITQN